MKFHPGGTEELMRGAGIDSTNLFDQVSCKGTVWVAALREFKLRRNVCCCLLLLEAGSYGMLLTAVITGAYMG